MIGEKLWFESCHL